MKTSQDRDLNPSKNPLRAHGFVRHSHQVVAALGAALWLALVPFATAQGQCSGNQTPAPHTPLPDLGQNNYIPGDDTSQGGLYPGGYNQRPSTYNTVGIHLARNDDGNNNGITPRDSLGNADPNGKIVMISIGMCNSSMEFGGTLTEPAIDREAGFQFRVTGVVLPDNDAHPCPTATPSPTPNWKNEKLVVIDCAQSHMSAPFWATRPATQDPWMELQCRLDAFGVTKKQVQVVWLKEALAQPGNDPYGPWPKHVEVLKLYVEQILDHLVNAGTDYGFGNVKMVFLSPRTHAWDTNPGGHSPEPYAYETGFADKWLIDEKMNHSSDHPTWPWLSWGPYIWADGIAARSDGLTWPASWLKNDCTHPLTPGVRNVANQLLAFFKTDPVATPWFLKSPTSQFTVNVNTSCDSPDCSNINAGKSVTFTASLPLQRNIAEYVWTFDDGTYHFDPDNPTQTVVMKTFPAPSNNGSGGSPYHVHVTAIDLDGKVGFKDVSIRVNAVQPRAASIKDKDAKDKAATLPKPKQKTARKVVAR